jgi:hypothetical protein
MIKMKLADLKRLPLGTKLYLTNCLVGKVVPPAPRTVALVQTNAIAFKREDREELSWLTFPKAKDFQPTENGFRIMEGDLLAAEYVYSIENRE